MKQAANGLKQGSHKPQPEVKPRLRQKVGPWNKQVSSGPVKKFEQVVEELRAEVVKREQDDQLEDAIFTVPNFIQQTTTQRVRAEVMVPISSLVTSTNDAAPMSSKETSWL
jgi:hypothetical protein